MAVTGRTSIAVVPGVRKVSPFVVARPEASVQTCPRGAIAVMTAGNVASAATGCPTSIFGFFVNNGQNLTADGAKDAAIYRVSSDTDQAFEAVLDGTWTQTMAQSAAALSMNTAGVVVLKTGTAVSDSYVCRMQRPTQGFVAGDVNPVVSFVMLAANVQVA